MNATPSSLAPGAMPPEPFDPDHMAGLFDDHGHDPPDDVGDLGTDSRPGPQLSGSSCAAEVAENQLIAWIEAVVDRDERALTALYDATVSLTYAVVLRIVRRPTLAEEVVEDAYFQVWRQAARFDRARGRALTWLLGMARSRAIDAVRREARFQHDSLDAESTPALEDVCPPIDDLLDVARGHADLHRALLLLNAQPRQLVAMAFLHGLSHEEIAGQTALPLGTVKSQIRRALLTLRQALDETGWCANAS